MSGNEYLRLYHNDRRDKYHHLPSLETARKISCVLSRRFKPKLFGAAREEMLADKFNVTDTSLRSLLTVLDGGSFYIKIDQ